MSRICELSDDLLVKILSLLKTKDVVATSLLSKRWLSLWKQVPKLDHGATMDASASDFMEKFLLLNNAPVLETFRLVLGDNCAPEEHERWVNTAVARHVRVLELIHYRFHMHPMPCPRSLFTCRDLAVLRLKEVDIYDIPKTISLKSLKTLSLLCVRFSSRDEDLVHSLLSACPILETLIVRRWLQDRVTTFTIEVPSLQSLYIMERPRGHKAYDARGYVVNAPCLKTLQVFDKHSRFRSLVKMPKLVKAEVKIRHEDTKELMGCLTSAKHLSLCLNSSKPMVAKSGDFFSQLEYLELCTRCSSDWLCLLLRHSPKLRVLRLNRRNCGMMKDFEAQWEQPCCVPECLVKSLQTVEWVGYRGIEPEKEAAIFIFEKANYLKKMR